jgi:hypothetical protein
LLIRCAFQGPALENVFDALRFTAADLV